MLILKIFHFEYNSVELLYYVFLFNLHPMYNDNVHFDLPDNIRFINPNPFFDINDKSSKSIDINF